MIGEVIENNACKSECANRGFIVNNQNVCNFCNNSFFLFNGICLEECPIGYISDLIFHDCKLCPDELYAYNDKCVPLSDCNKSSIISNIPFKNCFDCSKINKLKEDNKCVDTCTKPYHVAYDNLYCDLCYNKYTFENKCIDECPYYTYKKYIEQSTQVCLFCEKLIEDGTCVNECSENYEVDGKNSCFCDLNIFYLTESKSCVLECPINTTSNKITRKCISKAIEDSSIIDEELTPINCKFLNKVYENDKCINFCSNDYFLDIASNTCINQCKINYYPTYNGFQNVCTKCEMLIQDNLCVDKCNSYNGPDLYNICKPCKETERIYSLDGICVQKCPDNFSYSTLYGHDNVCYLSSVTINKCTSDKFHCKNNGNCEQSSNQCKCSNNYFGSQCELTADEFDLIKIQIDNLLNDITNVTLESITSEQIDQMLKLASYIKILDNKELKNKIISLALSVNDINNINKTGLQIFKLLDTSLIISNDYDSFTDELSTEINKKIKNLSIKPNSNSTILYSGESLIIQMTNNDEKSKIYAITNKLALINFEQCEAFLKESNIISENESLYSINANIRLNVTKVASSLVDSEGKQVDSSLC